MVCKIDSFFIGQISLFEWILYNKLVFKNNHFFREMFNFKYFWSIATSNLTEYLLFPSERKPAHLLVWCNSMWSTHTTQIWLLLRKNSPQFVDGCLCTPKQPFVSKQKWSINTKSLTFYYCLKSTYHPWILKSHSFIILC